MFYRVIKGVAKSRAVGFHVEEGEHVNYGEDEAEKELLDSGGTGCCFLEPQPNGHEEPVSEAHGPDEPPKGGSEDAEGNDSCR